MVTAQLPLAALCGSAVGFSLGLIGGGGSILAVPMLLYIVGVRDPHVAIGTTIAARLLGVGLLAGTISGFFGIGGGFLIAPGLMLGSGMTIIHAVGSSLVSVGLFGMTTAANYARSGLIDWPVAAAFIAGGALGGPLGVAAAIKAAADRRMLTRLFAVIVFTVAAYMLVRSAMQPAAA